MDFVNLTGSDIVVYAKDGKTVLHEIPEENHIYRFERVHICVDKVEGVPIARGFIERYEELPEPEDGIMYIVPYEALDYLCKNRHDIVAPAYDNSAVRDKQGKVIGITTFLTAETQQLVE